jgi:hypothetical protein
MANACQNSMGGPPNKEGMTAFQVNIRMNAQNTNATKKMRITTEQVIAKSVFVKDVDLI